MRNNCKRIKNWFANHKETVIFVGEILLLAVVGGTVAYLQRDSIKCTPEELNPKNDSFARSDTSTETNPDVNENIIQIDIETVNAKTPINGGEPFDVSAHIKNLPKNQHASPEKINEALQAGVILEDGQTWVTGYQKNAA